MRRIVLVFAGFVLGCGTEAPGPPVTVGLVNRALSGRVVEAVEVAVGVLDAAHRPVPGVPLAGTVAEGSLVEATVTSDRDGIARFVWMLGSRAGEQVLQVRIGIGGPLHDLMVSVLPGAATTGAFTVGRVVTTGASTLVLPVVAHDEFGNVVSDPPISSSEALARVDSGRVTPNLIGGVRLVLDLPVPDTLELFVHPPSGAYRAVFRLWDTVVVETGTLVPGTDPATACPVSATAVTARAYHAEDVTHVRRVGAWADTVTAALRAGAVVHVIEPGIIPGANQAMRYRPLGVDTASSCEGTQFVRPWRFAMLPNFADSLVITP